MRLATALLVLAAAAYPVPREPGQLFYVQRSMNANTVIYVARMKHGALDPAQPVRVFWRRYEEEAQTKDLSALERRLAFGVTAEPAPGQPGAYRVRVVSYPGRPALLRVADGVPRLELTVAGEPSVLDHAYLHVDDGGSLPRVTRVDLYARSLKTGRPVRESFTP